MGGIGAAYYKVDIQSLGFGEHEFNFDIDSEFFNKFENSIVSKGDLKCRLTLNTNERLIAATFEIKGLVELVCDNSLELFDHPMEFNRDVIFKYGEEYVELDETTIQIPRNIDQLDVGKLIYEFLALEIPMRKIHPKFADQNDNAGLFFSTDSEKDSNDPESSVDPRWSALKSLKK